MIRCFFSLALVLAALLGCSPVQSFIQTNRVLPENGVFARSLSLRRAEPKSGNPNPGVEPDLLY